VLLPANLLDTTQVHLEQLIQDRTPEGQNIDFKRELPAAWDNASKHKFLADVAAFANSSGGDLIYGLDEDGDGQAERLVPQGRPMDEEMRRLLDVLANQVDPRIPGIQIHPVPTTAGDVVGQVLVIRVPQSWAGPHRIKLGQHFFIREGARNRPLDVPELRSHFLRSEAQERRVRDFRTERIGKILIDETPRKLVAGARMVAHVVPVQAALGVMHVDPVPYAEGRELPFFGSVGRGGASLNIDGAFVTRPVTARGTFAYTLLFRNGFFEAVLALDHNGDGPRTTLNSPAYEQAVIGLLTGVRRELAHLGANQDVTVMLTLLHGDVLQLGVPDAFYRDLEDHAPTFDRKIIAVPDVLVRADMTPERGLRPVFDMVWQAAGFTKSANYTDEGEWAPRR
jgi:hypothetical protein